MALTPDEAAMLARLQAKAVEPEPPAAAPVVVAVEVESPEPPAPPAVPAPAESEADIVLAGAQAQALVIEAQTDAEIRLLDHQAQLRAAEDARLAALAPDGVDDDAASLVDELLGPVVDTVAEVDTVPAPSHWFFRTRGRR